MALSDCRKAPLAIARFAPLQSSARVSASGPSAAKIPATVLGLLLASKLGPVGFEPTTKGFTVPRRFRREWTISSPVHEPPCVWVRDARSLLLRALEPSGSLCTFRRCTGGSAQGSHGLTSPEGFPEFVPSTSRVSARRHLSMSPLH